MVKYFCDLCETALVKEKGYDIELLGETSLLCHDCYFRLKGQLKTLLRYPNSSITIPIADKIYDELP